MGIWICVCERLCFVDVGQLWPKPLYSFVYVCSCSLCEFVLDQKNKQTTGIVCALFVCLNVYVFVYVCVFCTYDCVLEREYLVLFMCKCTFMYFSDQLFLLL